jgi:hypothetical protein
VWHYFASGVFMQRVAAELLYRDVCSIRHVCKAFANMVCISIYSSTCFVYLAIRIGKCIVFIEYATTSETKTHIQGQKTQGRIGNGNSKNDNKNAGNCR